MAVFTTSFSDKCKAFREAFRDMNGVTTLEVEYVEGCENSLYGLEIIGQDCGDFNGRVYIDGIKYIAVCSGPKETWDVFINNPNCDIDKKGCAIFTEEYPEQQWVFGKYKSFKRALNRAVTIVKAHKYPKPKEIW